MVQKGESLVIELLNVDREGVITDATPGAKKLLGDVVGAKCWETVRALGSDGHEICREGCSVELCSEHHASSEHKGVEVRTHAGRLVCSQLSDGVVVVLNLDEIPRDPGEKLSPREREVLSLVSKGFTGPEISEHLKIRPATVRHHVESAREKLGACTRSEAVARAIYTDQLG